MKSLLYLVKKQIINTYIKQIIANGLTKLLQDDRKKELQQLYTIILLMEDDEDEEHLHQSLELATSSNSNDNMDSTNVITATTVMSLFYKTLSQYIITSGLAILGLS